MSPKINTKKTKHSSLLLPREMFATEKQQLVVSLLMFLILIIQVYVFISIFRIVDGLAQLQGI